MRVIDRARELARRLKRDAYVVYFVARDGRTPWYARALAVAAVAYAFSPFDLIPDFVPVLGYLDDVLIVPLMVALVLRLVPRDVLAECRAQAEVAAERPVSRAGAAFMIGVWLGAAALVTVWVYRVLSSST
jgi:uncharacterized membrane protein YkvA (DUF1232 family)